MWLFIQNQVLGMQWLNEVVVAILQYAGVDVQSRVGVTVPSKAPMIFAQIPRNRPIIFRLRSGGK